MDQVDDVHDTSRLILATSGQPIEDAPICSSAQLLDYERQIVEDLITEDALCITSSGMGWQKVSALPALQYRKSAYCFCYFLSNEHYVRCIVVLFLREMDLRSSLLLRGDTHTFIVTRLVSITAHACTPIP